MRIRQVLKFKDIFQKVIDELKSNNINFFIAGGSVLSVVLRQDTKQDLDLFFRTKNDYNRAKMYLSKTYHTEYESDNAITFTKEAQVKFNWDTISAQENVTVQIIKRSFGSPEDIISNFDLNKSMIAYEDDEVIIDPRFSEPLHIITKHTNSLKRALKYCDRLMAFQKENPRFSKANLSIDWISTIKEFDSTELVPDFYNDEMKPANEVLQKFLKELFTNITTNENIPSTEIKEVLNKMDLEYVLWLLKDAFIPMDYQLTYYYEKVLYYKILNKSEYIVTRYKDVLNNCISEIKDKNPEILFE